MNVYNHLSVIRTAWEANDEVVYIINGPLANVFNGRNIFSIQDQAMCSFEEETQMLLCL